jgi:hypothetical protein
MEFLFLGTGDAFSSRANTSINPITVPEDLSLLRIWFIAPYRIDLKEMSPYKFLKNQILRHLGKIPGGDYAQRERCSLSGQSRTYKPAYVTTDCYAVCVQ